MPDGGLAAVTNEVAMDEFAPCGKSQEKSVGWVPPRGIEHGEFLEHLNGHYIARLAIETKSVPSSEITKYLDARCAHIEATTGRKVGKRERREIKEDAKQHLLPNAFPKRKDILVWIDVKAMRVVIDTASRSVADDVVTMLVRAGLTLGMLNTAKSPATFMHNLMLDEDEAVGDFTLGRECELEAVDESKAKVTFKNHPLDSEAVQEHIKQGKAVSKLGIFSQNCSFVMTEGGAFKKIVLINDEKSNEHDDAFDADVFIATTLISEMLNEMIEALGGEIQIEEGA